MADGDSVKTRDIKEVLSTFAARLSGALEDLRAELRDIDFEGAQQELSRGFRWIPQAMVEGFRNTVHAVKNIEPREVVESIKGFRFSHVKAFATQKPFYTVAVAVGLLYLGSLPFRAAVPEVPPAPPFQRGLIEEPTISVYFHDTDSVRDMKIEEYLEGVVAGEMNPGWPREALAAQAIVARTFTWKKILTGGVEERGTDASTDAEEFQAYSAEAVTPNVRDAVRLTRGQVITYQGNPIIAWFHASSGGKTAAAWEGLEFDREPTPYVQVVEDVEITKDLEWQRTFTLQEIEEAARQVGVDTGPVRRIRVGRKGPSGRALHLFINGRRVSAPQFRLALGNEAMRSTLITSLDLEDDTVTMKGRGFGHGVGLSQWGAWLMAQRGDSPQDIVRFYFKNVQIERFWE